MSRFGFFRIAVAAPNVSVANPTSNADEICRLIDECRDADVILFPELSITGYTSADLLHQTQLLDASDVAIGKVAEMTLSVGGIVVVGAPVRVEQVLYNCGIVCAGGKIHAIIPKTFLPSYREFYEGRWFRPADHRLPSHTRMLGEELPFGTDILLQAGEAVIGIELCEDLWVPIPPSSHQALAGANVLLNLSASNELIGKAAWRRNLVLSQSGRTLSAYAYSSAGATESTTDLVFSGHGMIAENGAMLAERHDLFPEYSRCSEGERKWIVADVDLDRLHHERRTQTSFQLCSGEGGKEFRRVHIAQSPQSQQGVWSLKREICGQPFVPDQASDLQQRCREILSIQSAGLRKRLSSLPFGIPLSIGISGGLDSTLAILVAVDACDALGWSRSRIHGLTMPGFGTSKHTLSNAEALAEGLGVGCELVDIRPLCMQAFRDLGHAPFGIDLEGLEVDVFQKRLQQVEVGEGDLVFENVQARIRTLLLMNRGFVLGTGDLSEQALGWSTYNGDHMSMYNVNTSIPKTLVRYLVRAFAERYQGNSLSEALLNIARTPISPELLPLSSTGEIVQETEVTVGPYELHDFYLFHFVRYGVARDKLRFLADHAVFSRPYTAEEKDSALAVFFKRFFSQQFKRSCVPDGPKIGTVSLSPRGDWRMPSDADGGSFFSE